MHISFFSAAFIFTTAVAVPLSGSWVGSELDPKYGDTYSLGDATDTAIAQSYQEPETPELEDIFEEPYLSPRGESDTYPKILFDDGKTAIKTGLDNNGIPYVRDFMNEIENLGLGSSHPIFKTGRTQGAHEIEVMIWLDRFAKKKLGGNGYNFYRTFPPILEKYKNSIKPGRQYALVTWYRASQGQSAFSLYNNSTRKSD
ncbi:MAG: hypothetical protein Q9227_002355 [Pyrenula ochraceoflavens]